MTDPQDLHDSGDVEEPPEVGNGVADDQMAGASSVSVTADISNGETTDVPASSGGSAIRSIEFETPSRSTRNPAEPHSTPESGGPGKSNGRMASESRFLDGLEKIETMRMEKENAMEIKRMTAAAAEKREERAHQLEMARVQAANMEKMLQVQLFLKLPLLAFKFSFWSDYDGQNNISSISSIRSNGK